MRKSPEQLRQDLERVLNAAIRAVDPVTATERGVRVEGDRLSAGAYEYRLTDFDRVHILGAGKASARMAQAIEPKLGPRLSGGLVSVKDGYGAALDRIRVLEAGHPVPDRRSLNAAEQTLASARSLGAVDLAICLISGGASALWCLPAAGLTLEDKSVTTQALLASGAAIHEINTVRKHVSAIKGGRLAVAAAPATLLTLMISDVIGDDKGSIGSGPTAPDETTFHDALTIVDHYRITRSLPSAVRNHLRRGQRGEIPETPGQDHPALTAGGYEILASNRLALRGAEEAARRLGYGVTIDDHPVAGEAQEAGRLLAARARDMARRRDPDTPPAMLLCGGETTVTLRGGGKGGRNQELALAAALELEGSRPIILASIGTDGTDGPTDAAGALADQTTTSRGLAAGLDAGAYLRNHDSYAYWERLGDLIRTGPTGTNVMDIQVIIIA